MSRTQRLLLMLTATCLFALGLTACGSDDDPATPPAGGGDMVAPLVRHISPSDMDRSVGASEEIRIYFTEPMDPATVDVTLSSGGALDYEWLEDNRYLRVAHDAAWSPGEKVTATVGTGMKDAAGNALPQSFSTTFYTASTDLMLLDTMFVGGRDAVLLNGEIVLFFSERMDLTSFSTSTTIEELMPPKAVGGLIYGTWNGDTWTVTFRFDGEPTPNTAHRITVDGAGARTWAGEPLGDDLVIDFTTGSDVDETGPQILSVTPAVGAVVPTSTDRIVVTFTEPIDPGETEPADMSAILSLFMSREPVWNDTRDELTIYLQQPLPAGLRLYALYEDYDFYDFAGNGNVNPDSLSFTTQGTADPLPVRDDLKLYYSYSDDEDRLSLRQTMESISGSAFDRVLRYWDNGGYDPILDTRGMTRTSSAVKITSLDVEAEHSACTPAVDFLRLPIVASDYWEGETALVVGETNIVMGYSVDVSEEIYRERMSLYRKAPSSMNLWLDDCFDITIEYSMTVLGESFPFETGEFQYYFAPGLGVYGQEFYHYFWDGPTRTGDSEGEYYLWGASIDDRYDIDD